MEVHLTLSGDAAVAIVLPFVALLIGWIVATIGRVQIANRRADAWARLVDRLDADRAATLLASDDRSELETLLGGPERPHGRIIRAAQASIVLLTIGFALLWYAFTQRGLAPILAVVVLATGVGFSGAAAVAYVLSARWGLLSRGEGMHGTG